jgi:8-oxo-dGTP pyrophosphatase MutT (NUDIX family)
MNTKPDWYYRQSAVVPYRWQDDKLEVLLITSRKRKRWIIPKGIVEPDMTAYASAAKEALEEAGVIGRVGTRPIAEYSYSKWGGTCTVEVFPLQVEKQLDDWLEIGFRRRRWATVEEAVNLVEQPDMRAILRRFPKVLKD